MDCRTYLRECGNGLRIVRRWEHLSQLDRRRKIRRAFNLDSYSRGTLVAKGYGVGALVQVTADVTAWDIAGTYTFLGTTFAQPFVLNWEKLQPGQPNPRPPDETEWDVRLALPLSPSVIEGIEERRQGKDFSLQIDMTVLLLDGGEPRGPRTGSYYATHPTRTAQDRIQNSLRTTGGKYWSDGNAVSGFLLCCRSPLQNQTLNGRKWFDTSRMPGGRLMAPTMRAPSPVPGRRWNSYGSSAPRRLQCPKKPGSGTSVRGFLL